MARTCSCVPDRLLTTLVVLGTGFVVEGIIFFTIIMDLVTCEHVVCVLLGLVICAGIVSWILLWMKRVERLRDAKRKEYLLKDRPPARQHRVHPFAFEPATVVDTQPITYKQLFEPDQLLKTLLPRRQVALCEVHQYNAESNNTEAEETNEQTWTLKRSRSLPLLLPTDNSNVNSSNEGRWNTK